MKVPLFVTGSAAVLAVWLGATFAREVPEERYPQLGRGSLPITAAAGESPVGEAQPLLSLEKAEALPVAVAK